jgi:hypothetical protein
MKDPRSQLRLIHPAPVPAVRADLAGHADLVQERTVVDERWLTQVLGEQVASAKDSGPVERLRVLLSGWAQGFAERRVDVLSGAMAEPRRGLLADEASSFLRAIDAGVAAVDEAGFVTLPTVRPKNPTGRYALFSKLGGGVSLNLEYVIQVGAAAELILDHGWPADRLDFERGEFDTLAYRSDGSVGLAVEAKARAAGPDSLEGLLRFWFRAEREPDIALENNTGRKLAELRRLCLSGPVHLWLVADSARWSILASREAGKMLLEGAPPPNWDVVENHRSEELHVNPSHPYDKGHHLPGSVAARGRCSQHGVDSCEEEPVVSFQDRHGRWQSGCHRALKELTARGEISPPAPHQSVTDPRRLRA